MPSSTLLSIIVFLTGVATMMLEIVASRVLAPYLGTSIITWTNLIGVVLGSLSLGYWYGGVLADRKANFKILSFILLLASVYMFAIGIAHPMLLLSARTHISDIRISSFLASIVLVAPQSFLLGMVTPYVVKLRLQTLKTAGKTVGNLYALSAVGNIVGTFATGFVLLSLLGSRQMLLLIGTILLFSSFLSYFQKRNILVYLLLFGLVFTLSTHAQKAQQPWGLIEDVDSPYARIWVTQRDDPKTRRSLIQLVTNPGWAQSGIYVDDPDELAHEYTKYYRLVDLFVPNVKRALALGAGGYSYPKDFVARHPSAFLDVVEIDPTMTRLAEKYFHLTLNSRMKIFHDDARVFAAVRGQKDGYEAIFVDVFGDHYAIPFHLTTVEFIQQMYELLDENGVVIINLVSAREGPLSKFLRVEYKTYTRVFPHVLLLAVQEDKPPSELQNIMLVALKKAPPAEQADNPELRAYMNNRYEGDLATPLPLLTDDFAPVEHLTLGY